MGCHQTYKQRTIALSRTPRPRRFFEHYHTSPTFIISSCSLSRILGAAGDTGRYSRHDVAFLYVIPHGYTVRSHPACPRRYPREACCRCADDGVRSPPDNVPNWEGNREVDFPSGNPTRLRVGQYGESRRRTLRVVNEQLTYRD